VNHLPSSDPTWVLPLMMVVIGLLIATLAGVIMLPLQRPTITRLDPHDDPFGDQPEVPS
jgi:hypothetical protein